jgi:hypothetical protein
MASTHATTGTERRPPHALSGDGLIFHLADEVDALRRDLSRSSGQRSAKTLSKSRGLRLTLVVLEVNATMAPVYRSWKAGCACRPMARYTKLVRDRSPWWLRTCANQFRRPNDQRFW